MPYLPVLSAATRLVTLFYLFNYMYVVVLPGRCCGCRLFLLPSPPYVPQREKFENSRLFLLPFVEEGIAKRRKGVTTPIHSCFQGSSCGRTLFLANAGAPGRQWRFFLFARMAESAWLSRLARFRAWASVLLAGYLLCAGCQRRAGFVLRRRWAVRYRCRLRHWRLPGCSRRRRVRGLL